LVRPLLKHRTVRLSSHRHRVHPEFFISHSRLAFTICHNATAIYPGSFDPVTNGHLDIIERGCKLFDEIIVAILVHPEKLPFFTIDERREMLSQVCDKLNPAARAKFAVDISGLAGPICGCARGEPTFAAFVRFPITSMKLQMALRTADWSHHRNVFHDACRDLFIRQLAL